MPSDFQKYISSVLKSLPADAAELSLRSVAVGCKNKEDGTFLAQMLEKRPLVSLELSCGFFNSEGLKAFSTALPKMKNLMSLDISVNGLGEKDAALLAEILPATKIRKLVLKGNSFEGNNASALFKVLPQTEIRSLVLGHNALGAKGTASLAEGLCGSKVKFLDMTATHLTDESASILAKALPHTFVRKLNLGTNEITASGAAELAKALPDTNIESFAVYGNAVGNGGLKALSEVLPRTKITDLNLFNCSFSDEGGKNLLIALQHPDCRVSKIHLGLFHSADGKKTESLSSLLTSMLQKAAEANKDKEKILKAERDAALNKDFEEIGASLKTAPYEKMSGFDYLMRSAHCGRLPDVMTSLAEQGRILPAEVFFRPDNRGDTLLDIVSERRQFKEFFKPEHFDSAQKLQKIWDSITPDDRKQLDAKNTVQAFQKIKNAVMGNAVKQALKNKTKKNIKAAFRTLLKQKMKNRGRRG